MSSANKTSTSSLKPIEDILNSVQSKKSYVTSQMNLDVGIGDAFKFDSGSNEGSSLAFKIIIVLIVLLLGILAMT